MVKVGVLGAGGMGSYHARCYKDIAHAQLAAVADVASEKVDRIAAEQGCQVYYCMEDLFADREIDVIDVCLPTYLHERAVVGAAQAGKHVITEKPVALSLAEVDKQIAAVKRAGVKAMVAQVCRFMAHYAKIKEYLDRGDLGRPISAVAARLGCAPGGWYQDPKLSGGAVVDLHIHDLDLLYYLFGKPRSVFAAGVANGNGAWNQVHTSLNYGDHVAVAEASFCMPSGSPFVVAFRLLGDKGYAQHPFQAQGPVSQEAAPLAQSDLAFYLGGDKPLCPQLPRTNPVQAEIQYFVNCIEHDKPVEIASLEQARDVLEIALAARRSLETGQPIVL